MVRFMLPDFLRPRVNHEKFLSEKLKARPAVARSRFISGFSRKISLLENETNYVNREVQLVNDFVVGVKGLRADSQSLKEQLSRVRKLKEEVVGIKLGFQRLEKVGVRGFSSFTPQKNRSTFNENTYVSRLHIVFRQYTYLEELVLDIERLLKSRLAEKNN